MATKAAIPKKISFTQPLRAELTAVQEDATLSGAAIEALARLLIDHVEATNATDQGGSSRGGYK